MIGTRPADEGHPFAVALRDADYSQVHPAWPGDLPFQRRTWKRTNPSLDAFPDLEAANRVPSLLAQFRALRLNMGVADTEVSALLDAGLWAGIEGEAPRAGPCVWGVDLGTSAAHSEVAAFWPETGALACLAAFPEQPSLEEWGRRDGVAGLCRGDVPDLGVDTDEADFSIVVDDPSDLASEDSPGMVEVRISARRFERIVRNLRKCGIPHRIDTPRLVEFEPGAFRPAADKETPTDVYTTLRGMPRRA